MKLETWTKNNEDFNKKELEYLVKNILDIPNIYIDIELSEIALLSLNEALNLRKNHIPLAKIIQKKWFMEDLFFTNSHTLDPRSETEYIFEIIKGKPKKILELGVGTGCVLLSILKKFEKAKGVGVDISQDALKVAYKNSQIMKMEKKCKLIQNNWAYGVGGNFDLIVCNPPYVDIDADISLETKKDPSLALFGSLKTYEDIVESLLEKKENALCYEFENGNVILKKANHLTFSQLIFETDSNLIHDVMKLLKKYFKNVEKFQVYNTNIFIINVEI